jgi:hypothetical protein
MLGTINLMGQDDQNFLNTADILLYAGESADSQVLAVRLSTKIKHFCSINLIIIIDSMPTRALSSRNQPYSFTVFG